MNSTGRLSSAKIAIDLLTEEDIDDIYLKARQLVELNNERKTLTENAYNKAINIIEKNSYDKDDILVIYDPDFNESICGIVAGRIKEKYYKPTIVITNSIDNSFAKGSGRSIEAYNIYEEVNKFSDQLISFGGHPMACGLSLDIDKVDEFRTFLNQNSKLTEDDKTKSINIDGQIAIKNLSLEFAESVEKLKPFGKGNEKPIFANKNVEIASVSMIGKDKKTMKISFKQNGYYYNSIKFQAEDDYNYLKEKYGDNLLGKKIDILYYPDINEFRGQRSLQLRLIDIRWYNGNWF